jgi:hypothetical protein
VVAGGAGGGAGGGRRVALGGTAVVINPCRPIPARKPPFDSSCHFPPPTAAPRVGQGGISVGPRGPKGTGWPRADGSQEQLMFIGTQIMYPHLLVLIHWQFYEREVTLTGIRLDLPRSMLRGASSEK